jgi:alkylation response protein AidB-like acyl-CoA dehydrogenase
MQRRNSQRHQEEDTQQQVVDMMVQHQEHMMEMMRAFQTQNILALLPPSERAGFMRSHQMAALLEGGEIVPYEAPAVIQNPSLRALTNDQAHMSNAQARALLRRQEAAS